MKPRALILLLLVSSFTVFASAQTAAPTLTELQRLQLLTLVQRLELARFKALAAEQDFEAAKAELLRLASTLTVEGYDLDLSTQSYKPKVAPETAASKK